MKTLKRPKNDNFCNTFITSCIKLIYLGHIWFVPFSCLFGVKLMYLNFFDLNHLFCNNFSHYSRKYWYLVEPLLGGHFSFTHWGIVFGWKVDIVFVSVLESDANKFWKQKSLGLGHFPIHFEPLNYWKWLNLNLKTVLSFYTN